MQKQTEQSNPCPCMYIIEQKHLSSDFTFYPLVTGPVHSCAITTPRRAYSPAAVSAHWTYRTHCHLCPTRYLFSPESSEAFEGEVPCPRTQHPKIERAETWYSLKILHQAGFETARQAATSAECHTLTIAPCPSPFGVKGPWIYQEYTVLWMWIYSFIKTLLIMYKRWHS